MCVPDHGCCHHHHHCNDNHPKQPGGGTPPPVPADEAPPPGTPAPAPAQPGKEPAKAPPAQPAKAPAPAGKTPPPPGTPKDSPGDDLPGKLHVPTDAEKAILPKVPQHYVDEDGDVFVLHEGKYYYVGMIYEGVYYPKGTMPGNVPQKIPPAPDAGKSDADNGLQPAPPGLLDQMDPDVDPEKVRVDNAGNVFVLDGDKYVYVGKYKDGVFYPGLAGGSGNFPPNTVKFPPPGAEPGLPGTYDPTFFGPPTAEQKGQLPPNIRDNSIVDNDGNVFAKINGEWKLVGKFVDGKFVPFGQQPGPEPLKTPPAPAPGSPAEQRLKPVDDPSDFPFAKGTVYYDPETGDVWDYVNGKYVYLGRYVPVSDTFSLFCPVA